MRKQEKDAKYFQKPHSPPSKRELSGVNSCHIGY